MTKVAVYGIALGLALGLSTPPRAEKHCSTEMIDEARLRETRSIVIRPFSFADSSSYPAEVIERWSREMPRLLSKQLRKKGFEDVEIVDDERPVDVDLVIDGEFTAVRRGNSGGRILMGPMGASDAAATMQLAIQIAQPGSEKSVAILDCERSGYGGPFGMGGLLAGSSKVIMHNHMERFAAQTARIIKNAGDKKKRKKAGRG